MLNSFVLCCNFCACKCACTVGGGPSLGDRPPGGGGGPSSLGWGRTGGGGGEPLPLTCSTEGARSTAHQAHHLNLDSLGPGLQVPMIRDQAPSSASHCITWAQKKKTSSLLSLLSEAFAWLCVLDIARCMRCERL